MPTSLALNFKSLSTYISHINSHAFLRRCLYRLRHPGYFLNLIWILNNSISDLDNLLLKFKKNDQNRISEYNKEAHANVLGQDDYYYFLYTITRILKPKVIVETGVNEGYSSQAILSALNSNNFGRLYSIDLPNVINAHDGKSYNLNGQEVGYNVPSHLRKRWELRLGDSKVLLDPLLNELGEIDIFIHDSLHTYDHMLYEYLTAWPFINKKGLLISHDIQMNPAFKKFCSRNRKIFYIFSYNIGIAKK